MVLADCCSSDRTVELARAYPIRIVQLAHPQERCCGIAPQLGYQHSQGEFICLLDGDMQMLEGFLEVAVDFMRAHPEVAGVGGSMIEMNTQSLEYIARSEKLRTHAQPGSVDRLGGGGLYRRSAIESIGYLSNRNLHSYEELDLAVRLRSLGWGLWRLPVKAVRHFGHEEAAYRLLMSRWRNQYLCGIGELIRASAGQGQLALVLRGLRELRIYLGVLCWWTALLSIFFWPVSPALRAAWFAVVLAAPLLLMIWRKRSFERALHSVVSWCFNAAGLVRGLLRRQRPTSEAIASEVVKDIQGMSWMPRRGAGH